MMLNEPQAVQFREVVWEYYGHHGRHDMAWRQPGLNGHFDPYRILVSEVMLQQTQVSRVTPKFQQFLAVFPDVHTLAAATLGDVLREWSGLGYNRRAKFLWQAAQRVVADYGGQFPSETSELTKLPGVGINTAGAIAAYAYNQPVVFLETNIRTVLIHHFFNDQTDIAEKALRETAEAVLDREHPREWYWALMDYGSYLKQTVGNLNKLSKSYAKQSSFHGSRRQLRGAVIRLLGQAPHTQAELSTALPDERLPEVLTDLGNEGMIVSRDGRYHLS